MLRSRRFLQSNFSRTGQANYSDLSLIAQDIDEMKTLINNIVSGTVTIASSASAAQFPVGYVYISIDSTNPATILGYGTWERIAEGRAIVGVDETDTDFDAVEEEGGEKTHQLTCAEIPTCA